MLNIIFFLATVGSNDDIRVVEDGAMSSILQNNFTMLLPPIKSEFWELTIKFASERRVCLIDSVFCFLCNCLSMHNVLVTDFSMTTYKNIVFSACC